MDHIVNILARIERDAMDSGVRLRVEGDHVWVEGPACSSCLRVVTLYRPSSDDVAREAANEVLLILISASRKAALAARQYNYVIDPGNAYRIIGPGFALVHDSAPITAVASRQVRLTGRTGVVAESLLLGGTKAWTISNLAVDSGVTPALVHRVVTRLERENLLGRHGDGPATRRTVSNRRALAELWSQEEKPGNVLGRGFLYGNSIQTVARKIVAACQNCGVGGALAANSYVPFLTTVAPPMRIWVSGVFNVDRLTPTGFMQTEEGANVEFVYASGDPWRVHANNGEGIHRVSRWRAWMEISRTEGRAQELAEALMSSMETEHNGSD